MREWKSRPRCGGIGTAVTVGGESRERDREPEGDAARGGGGEGREERRSGRGEGNDEKDQSPPASPGQAATATEAAGNCLLNSDDVHRRRWSVRVLRCHRRRTRYGLDKEGEASA
ncbi:hypothetical protein B296_00044890 [Ensete ventricosum]|uniref:Uncharacterized protein n=1 Tax=Ensete ventricosum TaxID=4639 RepID=A0A426Z991_ENSVE|nr:hypothetical protein B296_00044890 [Ensete ventricosum]